ncbi:recombinase family protein [Cylindrospermopsis raciborskii]|uniref:recombinase family protein n=1 Tax=Cylindrospermopsis raciborskii TaxID=77022 RepID=UPI0022C71C30|nr:recombinase family protein [Cylindrospermopsis raciborskii]MCZ2204599.1 recombinase family protein [Cylindrospermopsis raciborskii PAMP2011]
MIRSKLVGFDSIWVVGASRSGKTTRLVRYFSDWVERIGNPEIWTFYTKNPNSNQSENRIQTLNPLWREPRVLVLTSNHDGRVYLSNRIATLNKSKYILETKTTSGFIQDEVMLFWPLIVEMLEIKAQFPLILRPETEQELATKLWKSKLNALGNGGSSQYRLVRRILDLWQLGTYAGIAGENIEEIFYQGLDIHTLDLEAELLTSLLVGWRQWCLQRGLLTYGLITELYHKYLFKNIQYQEHLKNRYQLVIADDVDNYPAIYYYLLEFLLDKGAVGAFGYNPYGSVRLGLGADPEFLKRLESRCQVENLVCDGEENLVTELAQPMIKLVREETIIFTLPETVENIQTISRAELLQQTTQLIIREITAGKVQPEEIAIIAPGLDAIARYQIIEILGKHHIEVDPLNEQRPLIGSANVRGLLTLLTLVYPGLGRLVNRDQVAEMLVVLSRNYSDQYRREEDRENQEQEHQIDPVRAGIIVDNCFVPDPENPRLLDIRVFDRWDRIGYVASTAYREILTWIEQRQNQQTPSSTPVFLLYAAMEKFIFKNQTPSFGILSELRELLETAQHYWEIEQRVSQTEYPFTPHDQRRLTNSINEFISLLRQGTITANPYPVRTLGQRKKAITLATVFQYRASYRYHKWHFWMDIGSPLWSKGGAASLFGSHIFLQDRMGKSWTAADEDTAETQRLERIIVDLLGRVSEKIYLCHSDLAVNGQEQLGPLSPLIYSL